MCDEIPVSVPVVGQTYNANEIWSRLKAGKPEPWTRPYWKGVPEKSTQQMDVVDFIFTPTHWHYGWRSNKHTNKSRHTCRMHAFAEMSDGMLLCIASTSEGAFTISSTKKDNLKYHLVSHLHLWVQTPCLDMARALREGGNGRNDARQGTR